MTTEQKANLSKAWEGRRAASQARANVLREILTTRKTAKKPYPTIEEANGLLRKVAGHGLDNSTVRQMIADTYGAPPEKKEAKIKKGAAGPGPKMLTQIDKRLANIETVILSLNERVTKLHTLIGQVEGNTLAVLKLWS